ncbi:hypothetical protein SAMN05421665_1546 [Yoonia rosea]|uniref:Uncharacterized protein n=1 Tax=Yoonia rosea TaxID=287098 RepID=A0A1R3WYJ3_9RHOB|nr:hypothetical protein [Yoonia rosea]SIT82830.1 hypothetical protein SAMN05421665_1546 [Yoonia rosea]
MGNFYVNLCVKTDDVSALLDVLGRGVGEGFLLDDRSGWLVVTTEKIESQDQTEVDRLGNLITAAMPAPAISFMNHDDDILSVDVFGGGARVGSYNSTPDYWDEYTGEEHKKPALTNPAAYAALAEGVSEADVISVMVPETDFVFAFELQQNIAKMLGLPKASVGLGYRYVSQGDLGNLRGMITAFGGATVP